MIGEPVYAIGNPFGFSGTMTRGIVSAVDRTLDVSKERSYTGLIQTDASINPGNSGGPLLNAYGQVVGINTAIKQGAMGIGFAISVSNMRDLLPTFLNPETLNLAERAEIGFALEEKRESRRPATVVASVLVKQVQEGSAAEKAGLKAGDQLVAVGGTKVFNVADALVDLAGTKPGETLSLNVLRGREPVSLKFPVTKAPLPPVEDLLLTKMGIKAETVTPALVEQYKLIFNQGVYIREVVPNSPAAVSGILPGDALIQLGRFRVASTEDVATLLKLFKPPVDWSVIIIRGDKRGDGIVHLK
jgi:serine protease Do